MPNRSTGAFEKTSCKITLDDKEAALQDLVAGTTVTITIKKQKGKRVAVKILARSAE
jgi:hypothetical protein